MARIWCDKADRAVQVLGIVPVGERFHPCLSVCLCGKALGRPVRAIFAGSEQGLRERVVFTYAWTAVGCGDAQFLHGHFHRGALHGAAVVGVQYQRAQDAAMTACWINIAARSELLRS